MIGLDTSVLLRFMLQDDQAQARIATAFISDRLSSKQPGYISLTTVLEVVWILRSSVGWTEFAIANVIQELIATDVFVVQNFREVYLATSAVKDKGAEFEDALIAALGTWAGCFETVTFDRKAARLPGVRRLA